MIDERTEELMWQQIDESISPEDKAHLDAQLVESPEAKNHFQELTNMSTLLDSVDEVEPPANLRSRIDDAIDWDAPWTQAATPRFDWRRFLTSWLDLRVAAAAAAGIMIGIIGYQTIISKNIPAPELDNGAYSGSMWVTSTASEPVIDAEGIQGAIGFRLSDGIAISDFQIESDREIDVVLEYEGQSVGFRAQSATNAPLGDISIKGNTVHLTHIGAGRYIVVFAAAVSSGAPMTVRITVDGEVLSEKTVYPNH